MHHPHAGTRQTELCLCVTHSTLSRAGHIWPRSRLKPGTLSPSQPSTSYLSYAELVVWLRDGVVDAFVVDDFVVDAFILEILGPLLCFLACALPFPLNRGPRFEDLGRCDLIWYCFTIRENYLDRRQA